MPVWVMKVLCLRVVCVCARVVYVLCVVHCALCVVCVCGVSYVVRLLACYKG